MKTIFNSVRSFLPVLLLFIADPYTYAQTPGSCNASFSACKLPSASVAGLSIRFANTSTGSYTNTLWTFGDGDTSTLDNPVHVYLLAKPFYVACLTVFNATADCHSSVCDTVYASAPVCNTSCIDSALINPSMACPDIIAPVCGCNGVTYNNACEAEYRYGVTTGLPGACHVQHTCQADFTYTFTLTPNSPSALVKFSATSTSSDSIVTYNWSFGDGTGSTSADPSHFYPVPG